MITDRVFALNHEISLQISTMASGFYFPASRNNFVVSSLSPLASRDTSAAFPQGTGNCQRAEFNSKSADSLSLQDL